MTRTDVAIIGTHIAPAVGYGGVAESLWNLVQSWARRGKSIALCVSDGSKGPRVTAAAIGLPCGAKVRLYRAMLFRRWGFGPGAVVDVLATCLTSRVVYICGIATWPTTLAAVYCTMLRKPFVVAPRGGLMSGHVAEIQRRKPHKWLFYQLITLPTLRTAIFIHVTSASEQRDVVALLPKAQCRLVVNGIDTDAWSFAQMGERKTLTFLFAGRISLDKGINRFARIWLGSRRPGERLLIAGDGVGDYFERLKALSRDADGAIELLGYLSRRDLHSILAVSDFLVLPSGIEGDNERENFGNTVAEALSTGRPVLVSRGLAWDLVVSNGIGFAFERNDDAIRVAINRARSLSAMEYERMCRTARSYAERNFQLDDAADELWSHLSDASSLVDTKCRSEST